MEWKVGAPLVLNVWCGEILADSGGGKGPLLDSEWGKNAAGAEVSGLMEAVHAVLGSEFRGSTETVQNLWSWLCHPQEPEKNERKRGRPNGGLFLDANHREHSMWDSQEHMHMSAGLFLIFHFALSCLMPSELCSDLAQVNLAWRDLLICINGLLLPSQVRKCILGHIGHCF